MSTKKEKDHWLPQFYLREFAVPGYADKKNAEIWLTDLRQGTCSKEKIADVAFGRNFYSFVDAGGESCRRVDDKLTALEDRVSHDYRVIARGIDDLNKAPAAKKRLALFFATILLRTPKQEVRTSENHERLRQIFDKAPKSSSGKPLVNYVRPGNLGVPLDTSDYDEWSRNDESASKQRFSEQIEELARPLADQLVLKRWAILCTDQPVFFTGDAPLIKIDGTGVERGINSPDTMIFFPLSPTRMLQMTDREEGEIDGYCPLPLDQAKLCNVLVTHVHSPMFLFSQTELRKQDIDV